MTLTTAIGWGERAHVEALAGMRPALRPSSGKDGRVDAFDELDGFDAPCWVGLVPGLEEAALTGSLAAFDCRNNRLAAAALEMDGFATEVERAKQRFGAHRVGLFLGTSTSGVRHTEQRYRDHFAHKTPGLGTDLRFDTTHAYVSLAELCRRRLRLAGPCCVVSTACSSGAKTFAAAQRALDTGLCDAAIAGGADTLCATTLLGFQALGLLSPTACTPWGLARSGISIGEGAAFALLERANAPEALPALLGYGESSDAHHIATPHPDGAGAVLAMRAALGSAGLAPADIDSINLHGTGTPANDSTEDLAVTTVFGTQTPVSATKGWTGHTLGAAGAVEAVISVLCIKHGLLPGTLNTDTKDPALGANLVPRTERRRVDRVLTNAFGFAGNNCSLVVGRR